MDQTLRLTLTDEAQQKLALELDAAKTQRKRVEEDSAKDFSEYPGRWELQPYSPIPVDCLPHLLPLLSEKRKKPLKFSFNNTL